MPTPALRCRWPKAHVKQNWAGDATVFWGGGVLNAQWPTFLLPHQRRYRVGRIPSAARCPAHPDRQGFGNPHHGPALIATSAITECRAEIIKVNPRSRRSASYHCKHLRGSHTLGIASCVLVRIKLGIARILIALIASGRALTGGYGVSVTTVPALRSCLLSQPFRQFAQCVVGRGFNERFRLHAVFTTHSRGMVPDRLQIKGAHCVPHGIAYQE